MAGYIPKYYSLPTRQVHAGEKGHARPGWTAWTDLPVEESIRITENSDKLRKYVHGVANPRIEDG